MRNLFAAALATALLLACAFSDVSAENVSSLSLRSVAAIMSEKDGNRVPVGTAFFVEVPSKVFAGNVFVYLVTARHNLLDEDRMPIRKLWVRLEDSANGVVRDDPLSPEDKWILDPKDASVDLAAVPFAPSKSHFTTIPLSWFLHETEATTIPPESQIGADAYFLTMTSSAGANPHFVPVSRFGKVSIAEPTRAVVPRAGEQDLCFLQGATAPEFSGAPVFLRMQDQFVFWGLMEASVVDDPGGRFSGLVGVLPASSIAETVRAMAAIQEGARKPKQVSP